MKPIKILFVCLGNICRSPLAHAVFQDLVDKASQTEYFEIESCGIGAWHIGNLPDSRMIAEAAKHGIAMTHPARRLQVMDFEYYDLILPMDLSNLKYLMSKSPDELKDKIKLFRSFDPESKDEFAEVPDPYYGGADGFSNVYDIVHRSCKNLLEELQEQLQ